MAQRLLDVILEKRSANHHIRTQNTKQRTQPQSTNNPQINHIQTQKKNTRFVLCVCPLFFVFLERKEGWVMVAFGLGQEEHKSDRNQFQTSQRTPHKNRKITTQTKQPTPTHTTTKKVTNHFFRCFSAPQNNDETSRGSEMTQTTNNETSFAKIFHHLSRSLFKITFSNSLFGNHFFTFFNITFIQHHFYSTSLLFNITFIQHHFFFNINFSTSSFQHQFFNIIFPRCFSHVTFPKSLFPNHFPKSLFPAHFF